MKWFLVCHLFWISLDCLIILPILKTSAFLWRTIKCKTMLGPPCVVDLTTNKWYWRFVFCLLFGECRYYVSHNLYTFWYKYDLFVWILSPHSRIFHSYGDVTIAGEGLQILTYTRHSWPLSSEGSLTCHTYCDMGHPFIMVIFEDPWPSHLLWSI